MPSASQIFRQFISRAPQGHLKHFCINPVGKVTLRPEAPSFIRPPLVESDEHSRNLVGPLYPGRDHHHRDGPHD